MVDTVGRELCLDQLENRVEPAHRPPVGKRDRWPGDERGEPPERERQGGEEDETEAARERDAPRSPDTYDRQRPRRFGVTEVSLQGRELRARADAGARAVLAVLAGLDQAGVRVAAATVTRPSLDDVYLRHVGRAYEEVAR